MLTGLFCRINRSFLTLLTLTHTAVPASAHELAGSTKLVAEHPQQVTHGGSAEEKEGAEANVEEGQRTKVEGHGGAQGKGVAGANIEKGQGTQVEGHGHFVFGGGGESKEPTGTAAPRHAVPISTPAAELGPTQASKSGGMCNASLFVRVCALVHTAQV